MDPKRGNSKDACSGWTKKWNNYADAASDKYLRENVNFICKTPKNCDDESSCKLTCQICHIWKLV